MADNQAALTTEQAQSYFAQHSLEKVIEEAVNQAVMAQVADPFEFIGNKLLQKSAQLQADSASRD